MHSDSQPSELMDREGDVTWVHEHVDAQKRQVDLAIDSLDSLRAEQDAGIEEPRAIALEQSEDASAARPSGNLRDLRYFATVARHGVRQALLSTAETVSRKRTLGEDDQPGPVRGGLLQTSHYPIEVLLHSS